MTAGLKQSLVEIIPFGIEGVDEPDLPGSRPMFHRFLFLDRGADIVENFIIDQVLESVSPREAVDQAFAMFETPLRQIAGDAGVKYSVAPTAHHVNVCGHQAIEQETADSSKFAERDTLSASWPDLFRPSTSFSRRA
jgi:hypothetical protein